jgi:Tfp pilus assembly protein PilO
MMNFEELANRYQMVAMKWRIIVALTLGLIPGLQVYFEDIGPLKTEKTIAEETLEKARQKYEEARQKLSRLPLLEKELVRTETELKNVSRLLPDSIHMDDVLQKMSLFALETGIEIQVFDPGEDKPGPENIRYMEVPIAVALRGRYSDVMSFFDRIVNLEKLFQIKEFDFTLDPVGPPPPVGFTPPETTTVEGQKYNRANARVVANGTISAFRSMTIQEEEVYKVEPTTPDGLQPQPDQSETSAENYNQNPLKVSGAETIGSKETKSNPKGKG